MKKAILISLFAAFGVQTVNAQLSIRPEIGLNSAKADMKYVYEQFDTASKTMSKIGYEAGFSLHAKIIGGLSAEAGLLYRRMQFKSQKPTLDLGSKIKESYQIDYGVIPVSLNYDFDLGKAGSVFAGAGGYWAHAFSGFYTYDDPSAYVSGHTEGSMVLGNDYPSNYRANDMGLLFQAGYNSPIGVFARVRYSKGLTNVSPDQNVSFKNHAWSFSLGYDITIVK